MSEYETQIIGLVTIFDCKNFPWSCLKWCNPKSLRIGAEKSDVFPMKKQEIHVINMPKIFATVVNAVRSALPQRINEKV